MNFRWATVAAIAALTLAVGCISYHCFHHPMPASVGHDDPALAWVEHEFDLSGEKLARVKAMHEAYVGVCAEHCRVIAETRQKLRELQAARAAPEEIAAVSAEAAAADAHCMASTREHIREVAAAIGGAQGQRYLDTVLPRVAGFDHSAPPTLDMDKTNKNTAHDHHAARN